MERVAFTMQLHPGRGDEYRRRHDEIWPELVALLRRAGISNYAIYLDEETHVLFATLERSAEHEMDRLPDEPVMRRWWDAMKDIMESNPDGSPVVRSLRPMFHLP